MTRDPRNNRARAPWWRVTILLRVDAAAISIQEAEEFSEELRRKSHGGHQADDSLTIYYWHVRSGFVSGVAMTTETDSSCRFIIGPIFGTVRRW